MKLLFNSPYHETVVPEMDAYYIHDRKRELQDKTIDLGLAMAAYKIEATNFTHDHLEDVKGWFDDNNKDDHYIHGEVADVDVMKKVDSHVYMMLELTKMESKYLHYYDCLTIILHISSSNIRHGDDDQEIDYVTYLCPLAAYNHEMDPIYHDLTKAQQQFEIYEIGNRVIIPLIYISELPNGNYTLLPMLAGSSFKMYPVQ